MGERLNSRLRERRTHFGLTQDILAAATGVSRQTINAIEAERFVPSTTLALRLAVVLRTTVENLFQLVDADAKRLKPVTLPKELSR